MHTPGPWRAMGQLTDQPDVVAVNPEGGFRGTIAYLNRNRTEWEANARLIAASPRLLEALEETIQSLEGISWANFPGDAATDRCKAAYQAGLTAITKARGSHE